jgi:formylglycine-generating enzyme required for sulfatase activity
MKTIGLLSTVTLSVLLLATPTRAADFEIMGITANGELTWEDPNTNGTYTVQWSPSLVQTNWSSDWASLTQIAATGGTIRARIPMFFRIIHRPRQSQTANMRLVSGGGQPQGPQYDFYIGKTEVTTDEFCEFLNDAQSNSTNARGQYCVFADSGSVFMDESLQKILFNINESRLIYDLLRPIGSRYSVQTDYLRHPITGVSWYGAVKYCNWLTIRTGRGEGSRCYKEGATPASWIPSSLSLAQWTDGFQDAERQVWVTQYTGYRLPMDHYANTASYYNEYYKAAAWNGSSNMVYGFGRNSISGQDCNFYNSGDPFDGYTIGTTPVAFFNGQLYGAFQTRSNANYYGIFDLGGNVEEWTTDKNYAGETDDNRSIRDNSWNDSGTGTFGGFPYQSAAVKHNGISALLTYRHLGFRVVSMSP